MIEGINFEKDFAITHAPDCNRLSIGIGASYFKFFGLGAANTEQDSHKHKKHNGPLEFIEFDQQANRIKFRINVLEKKKDNGAVQAILRGLTGSSWDTEVTGTIYPALTPVIENDKASLSFQVHQWKNAHIDTDGSVAFLLDLGFIGKFVAEIFNIDSISESIARGELREAETSEETKKSLSDVLTLANRISNEPYAKFEQAWIGKHHQLIEGLWIDFKYELGKFALLESFIDQILESAFKIKIVKCAKVDIKPPSSNNDKVEVKRKEKLRGSGPDNDPNWHMKI